jgi:hypothetical protein
MAPAIANPLLTSPRGISCFLGRIMTFLLSSSNNFLCVLNSNPKYKKYTMIKITADPRDSSVMVGIGVLDNKDEAVGMIKALTVIKSRSFMNYCHVEVLFLTSPAPSKECYAGVEQVCCQDGPNHRSLESIHLTTIQEDNGCDEQNQVSVYVSFSNSTRLPR